jgi:chemosensory pili system protein ChpC
MAINLSQPDQGVVDLSTLLFPLAEQMLIMPSVCVAEIMRMRELKPMQGAPDWVMGLVAWRHLSIPVVSFEALNGDPAPSSGTGSRIVILNAVGQSREQPFLGLVTQGVPHLLRITPEDIAPVTQGEAGPAVLQRVLVHGQRAAIPNLDYVQEQLDTLG